MKLKQITTHEAKTHLSKYLSLVMKGQEILISRGKDPIAKLVNVNQSTKAPQKPSFGTITSTGVEYTDDCFAPLNETELSPWGL